MRFLVLACLVLATACLMGCIDFGAAPASEATPSVAPSIGATQQPSASVQPEFEDEMPPAPPQ